MKNVVIISNTFFSVYNFRYDLILQILKKNNVHVISRTLASEDEKFYAKKLKSIGCKIHQVKFAQSFSLFDTLTLLGFYRKLINIKADYLLLYTIKPVIYGSIVAFILKIKQTYSTMTGLGFVYTSNGHLSGLLRFFVNLLYKFSLKSNQKVFFQNKDDLNVFVRNNLINKEKTRIIKGSGVNLKKFKTSIEKKATKKTDVITFLMVSRISRDKGVLEFLNSANYISKKYPNTKFLLIGKIDSNPSTLRLSDIDYLLTDSVRHLDFHHNIFDIIESSDVFVLPSYREGTPRSCLEAMALAKPIITTDVPGCREVVVDGYNGFLVQSRNEKKLSDAIEEIILKPEIIDFFGKNSLKYVQAFDVEKVNKFFLREIGLK